MSTAQALRALVSERLAAAAEDIFVLFERMMVEHEEELRRSKEETQRKQQLLDSALSPRTDLVCGNVHFSLMSPGPVLNQDLADTPRIKEEPSIKHEEEQLLMFVPESNGVFLKTEESSVPPQRQTEHREETQGENVISETEGHVENLFEDFGTSFCISAAQIQTKADGDYHNQVQIINRSTALPSQHPSGPEASVHSGVSGAEGKKHQCPFCNKRYVTKQVLQRHIRVHTGERPYTCSVCQKTFTLKSNLYLHKRVHTGEKPYSCAFCPKTFTQKGNLELHTRTHTGEKPFSCSVCHKAFSQKSHVKVHMRSHQGQAS